MTTDLCLAGNPAQNGCCGEPGCVCEPACNSCGLSVPADRLNTDGRCSDCTGCERESDIRPVAIVETTAPKNAQESVEQYVKWLADFEVNYNAKKPGEACQLKARGQFWTPAKKPRRYPYGPWKHCFKTAYDAAHQFGLRYVEGIGLHYIPAHHAWNADEHGNVIDLTWRTTGKRARVPLDTMAYFGVEVPREELDRILLASGTYGAIFKEHGFFAKEVGY